MPAQAVARLYAHDDICTNCGRPRRVYEFSLKVIDHSGAERGTTFRACRFCMDYREAPITIRENLKIKDVIDVNTKAAGRSKVRRSQKREMTAAEQVGGRTTPGSGSGIAKGDVRTEHWMVEDKGTTGSSYTLSLNTLRKAVGQASASGRRAVMKIGLNDETELAVMLWSDAQELIHENG